MITTPTAFVLGAGASEPYGFPLGGELVDRICSPHDGSLIRRFEQVGADLKQYEEFKKELYRADPQSVDLFLEGRQEFKDIGKLAIADHLIQWEMENRLFRQPDSWYQVLWHRISGTFDALKENRVFIITFNYDRSLEHYLFTTISSMHGRTPDEVADIFNYIQILHVYGNLGSLQWQVKDGEPFHRYQNRTGEKIRDAAESITIVSDVEADTPEFRQASDWLELAERIYFLGFGYHDANMNRLRIPWNTGKATRKYIAGTSYGYTHSQQGGFEKKYRGLRFKPLKAYEFLLNDDKFVQND